MTFGIAAALCWGSADFLAGVASRTSPILMVMLISQAVALVIFACYVAVDGSAAPGGNFFVAAALAGLAEACGLAAFYSGLSRAAMGVVAPISATAGLLPMVVGLAGGDRVSTAQVVGMVVTLLGIVLTGLQLGGRPGSRGRATGVGLALAAAVSFGLFFVAMRSASREGNALWAVLIDRVTMVTLLAGAVTVTRPSLGSGGRRLPAFVLIGCLDTLGTTSYAAATAHGILSVTAVIASTYPAITIILARFVIGERLPPVQRAGSVLALAGVALINV